MEPPSPPWVRSVPKNAGRLARPPSSPTFFASGASEGGEAGEGGVSEGLRGRVGTGHRLRHLYRLRLAQFEKMSARTVGTGQVQLVLAGGGYDLYCMDSAYSAKTIATKIAAYRDEVSMATLVVRAPNWAKAVATDAAARNGRNIEGPFGLIGDKEKRPGR